jgi:transposase
VLNLVRGTSPGEIAKVLHCSRSQVYRIGRRFVEQGVLGLVDQREDNGEIKVDEDYEAVLLEAIAGSPQDYGWDRPTWTQELLILVCEQKTGIRISKTTMSRVLRRLPVRLGKPKPYVYCPWKKARRTRRLNEIQRLIEHLPKNEVALYVDEVDVHLNPKIGSDWMLRGTQKWVLTPGKNEKRYLAGALNAKSGELTWVESDRKTSDLFIDQLWTLVQRDYPNAKCIHLILDNYRIHSSNRTKIALKALEGKIKLHFLPPYCPDHNKIERVWQDLHANVTRNHRCRSMKDLMKCVRNYLERRKTAAKHEYVKTTNK